MQKEIKAIRNDLGTLAEDARALMSATAGVAGDKVAEARQRLAAGLEKAGELYGRMREKSVAGARAADEAVREHPYHALGIAFGIGIIAGCLAARSCGRNRN